MNGLTKELTTALVSVLLASFSGCLGMGCVGHGSRTIEIELPFDQRLTIKDTIPLDEEGKSDFSRGLDPDAWKFLFGWLIPVEADAEPDGD